MPCGSKRRQRLRSGSRSGRCAAAAGVRAWAWASGTMAMGVAETTTRTVRPRKNRRVPRSVSIVGPKLNRRAPSVNKCRPYAPAISAPALALRRQRALRERDREDLVWAERIVERGRPVDDVVAVLLAWMPEAVEAPFDALGLCVPGPRRAPEAPREPPHRPQRVVPEG